MKSGYWFNIEHNWMCSAFVNMLLSTNLSSQFAMEEVVVFKGWMKENKQNVMWIIIIIIKVKCIFLRIVFI